MKNSFGNYVVQKALKLCNGFLKVKLTNNIKKNIDVEKLAKGRGQESLEFLQWLKKYYDVNFPGGEYDAEKRRNGMGLDTETLNMKKRDNSKNRDVVASKLRKVETEKVKKTTNITIENKENSEPNKESEKSIYY